MSRHTVWLQHNLVRLALHRLQDGPGRPLLLLHSLGGHAPDAVPQEARGWPGPVWALDFTGHGHSDVPSGGGYTAEVLMADADAALGVLGPCTVLGRGVGAYVTLLLAGARANLVRGAVLADGPGLAGGGTGPSSPMLVVTAPAAAGPPDPWALVELARDVRPPDYATAFARLATELSGLEQPVTVAARFRPPWLEAVADEFGVGEASVEEALRLYAAAE